MAQDVKYKVRVKGEQAVQAAEEPVSAWRRLLNSAGAFVGRPWRRYRAAVFQGYVIGAAVVFLALAVLARTDAYFSFDLLISRAVQSVSALWFGALMYDLSWLGFAPQSYAISVLALLILLVSGLKWEAVVTAVGLAGSGILVAGIKILVERQRPSANLIHVLAQLHDYSFPSGHVLMFTAFYGFLLFLTYTLLKRSWWRTLLLLVLGGLVALIGLSRVYEGEHWPSDVLGAYLVGSLWLTALILLYRWGKPRFFAHQPAAPEAPRVPQGPPTR